MEESSSSLAAATSRNSPDEKRTGSAATTTTTSHKRAAADRELRSFVAGSCAKRIELSGRVRTIQTHSSNQETVKERLDACCRRMLLKKVDGRAVELEQNLERVSRELGETGLLLEEFHAYHTSQQHLLESADDLSPEHKSEMEALIQECGTEIRELENKLAGHRQSLESVRQDKEGINLEGIHQYIWSQYMAKRGEMIESSMAAVAQDLPRAQADVEQHDSEVKAKVDLLLNEPDGASIKTSHVLHSCASHLVPEYIDLMLGFLPECERRDSLNSSDEHGSTPLMAAAVASVSPNKGTVAMRYHVVEKLIKLGADKRRKDPTGKTALKKFCDCKERDGNGTEVSNSLSVPQESSESVTEDLRLENLLHASDDSSKETNGNQPEDDANV